MPSSHISISAQYGGRDAANVALPHFWAIKQAAKGIVLHRFPFPELAFILRVDGEVHSYGFSGVSHLDIDRDGVYLSVDIGITLSDRSHISKVIQAALVQSIELIRGHKKSSTWDTDFDSLTQKVTELYSRYQTELNKSNT